MARKTEDLNYPQALQEYSRRLEILHETALRINQAEREDQVYKLLLEQLGSVVYFDSASVLLVDGDSLQVAASIGFPAGYVDLGLRVPLTERTPSLEVVRHGRAMRVENMHESYPAFAEDSPATAAKIASWMGVPLTWNGRTIGQIALDRWCVEAFAQDDLRLATVIANHAAGAIERIRLHRQVLENNEKLELRVAQRTAEIEQAQSAIRNLAERLELATRTAGIGVWDWDLANKTLFLDQNTRRLFKLPLTASPDYVYHHWLDYIHPEDRKHLLAEFAAAAQGQHSRSLRFRILLPDGSVRHIHSTAAAIAGLDGKLQRVIGVATDITKEWEAEVQRARTQENLRKSEEHLRLINAELERTSRIKDEFLANMSHELRTPLNAILILGESLQEEVYGPINDRQRRALTDVVESGHDLLALINDILDLSKIEAGKMELQYNSVSVAGVCQASLRLVREMAGKKRQALSLQLPGDAITFWADERRLKQMLVNLLGNAVKFTPDGGQVGLQVCISPTGAEVCFVVWDTGIGIAPDLLPHLFQPFAQLDSALNRQYGGTGLGLALVRRLAELHGGRVEVQSQEQTGSRFTVVLPFRSSAPADAGELAAVEDLGTYTQWTQARVRS
jgi:signal transduction histidine kinase